MAATSARASNAPTPKPPSLVEAKGWNRRLRTKSASMPGPWSTIAIGDLVAVAVDADGDRLRRAGWRRPHSGADGRSPARARRVGHRPSRRRRRAAARRGRPRCAAIAAASKRAKLDRRRARTSRGSPCGGDARRAGRSSCRPSPCSVATMSARNSGLSAWRSALRATQRQLADQVLDVVEDEGEAAVEFLEPLGVDQRLLAVRFGQARRRLAPGGAEQVEILPVERAAISRARRARRGRPAARRGSAGRRPRRGARRARRRGWRAAASRASSQPPRRASKSTIRPSRAIARQKAAAPRGWRRRRGWRRPASSSRRRARIAPFSSGASSRPPGASRMSANALTTRSPSGAASGPLAPERVGEAQPFGAIIVAMLEQMLGELDLGPAARAARLGSSTIAATVISASSATARSRGPVDPAAAQRGGEHRHHREIGADREQRERLEGGGARQADAPALAARRRRARTRARSAPPPARASRTGRARRRWSK